jgi:hypothetical protein
MNPFNLRRRKIQLCKNKLYFEFVFIIFVLNSVKGIVERIEDNDDPRKRISERASAQAKLPSDKVKLHLINSRSFI